MNSKGYTIVETVFVLLIFVIVIYISTTAFDNLVKGASKQGKTAESNIEGIVGLEMMRTDISHAGYALPWAFQNPAQINYTEVNQSPVAGFEVNATTLNDAPSGVPRAIVSATGATTGIRYLALKGAVLGMNRTAKSWNFVSYAANNASFLEQRPVAVNDQYANTNLQAGDLAITLQDTFTSAGAETRTLLMNGATYSYTAALTGGVIIPPAAFQPTTPDSTVMSYGISTGAISMPFNRVDYYVDKTATRPASCNSGTGVLYKAVANHATKGFTTYPLLDCVGDMQIVFDIANAAGNVVYSTTLNSPDTGAPLSAAGISSQVMNTRVYLLTHEGKMDRNYSYTPLDATNAICVGPMTGATCSSTGRLWTQANMALTFGANWKNYRWKVYSFTANMRNLQ
jgi:hypothetical protein